MERYLIIESRDPFESTDTTKIHTMVEGLLKNGADVTLFLVQNGVFAARHCEYSSDLTNLAGRGAVIVADDFSLRERGIDGNRLVDGVTEASLDKVVDELAGGAKTIWH